MKGKRLLILGVAFALGLSACASSATLVRKTPLNEETRASRQILTATLAYTNNTTTTMAATGNANRVGLDATIFSVDAGKGETNNFPGLNKAGDIRLYSLKSSSATGHGSYFIVTITGGTIQSIAIDFKQNGTDAVVYSNETVVTAAEDVYTINSSSFKVENGYKSDGSANTQVQINSITINYELTASILQLGKPNPLYDSASNKVTWEDVPNASTYQVSVGNENNYQEATSPYGDFTVGASYTVYVKAIGDGVNYSDSESAYVEFTAVAPFVSKKYALCTSTDELKDGDSVIIGNGTNGEVKFLSSTQNTNNRSATSALEVNDGLIESSSDVEILTLGQSGDNWTFYANNTPGYLYAASSSANHLKTRDENSDANSEWSITINSSGIASITAQGSSTRNQLKNNGNLFACYASGQTEVSIWKEYSDISLDGLSLDDDTPNKTEYIAGESFDPAGLEVYAILDGVKDETINLASSLIWTPNPLTVGTTSVTGTYKGKTVEVGGLSVTAAPGSEDNPFTIAQAIAHIDSVIDAGTSSGNDNNIYYATGIISEIVTPYNQQYGNISYNISADGSTSGDQLEVYRGVGNNDIDASNIEIGATVVISGKLTKFNSTYEFAQGNTLVSYVESSLNLVSIELSGDYQTVFYVGDTFHCEGLVVIATFDDGTEKDVTRAVEFSGYNTSVEGTQQVTVSFKHKNVTKTATYNIVIKTGVSINYELFEADTFVEGDYLIYYAGGALNTEISSHRAKYNTLTPSNNVISNNSENVVWHIAPSGNYYTIYNKVQNKYLASTGVTNQIQLLNDCADDKSLWSITIDNGSVEIINKYNSDNELHSHIRRNEEYGFACYGESTGGALSLYKKVAISYLESATPVATIRGVAETDNNGKVTAVNELTLRFGVKVSADEWDAAGITEYGVKMFFANSLDGVATVESRGNNVATVSANAEPFKDGQGNYIFMAVVRIPDDSSEWPTGFDKNTYFCVRPYVKVGEQTHWLLDGDIHESIKTLAIARNNTNLTEDALDFLAK